MRRGGEENNRKGVERRMIGDEERRGNTLF